MAKNKQQETPSMTFGISSTPPLPTPVRARLSGGRVISADPGGGLWIYRRVPMAPMVSAKSDVDRIAAGGSLMAAYSEIAEFSRNVNGRRGLSKSSYRQTHLLWVNVPRFYDPGDHPNAMNLRKSLGGAHVNERVLLLGVRLLDSLEGSRNDLPGIKGRIESFKDTAKGLADQFQYRTGVPVDAFSKDYERMDSALQRAGLEVPTNDEFRLANAWWNHGRRPDTPFLPHLDHMHVFSDTPSMRAAENVGRDRCDEWAGMGVHVQSLTMASVSDFDYVFDHPANDSSMWAMSLFREGAVAISVRGAVEPAVVTRGELRRNKQRYADDIQERFEAGKMRKTEQEEHLAHLSMVEAEYSSRGTPTIVDASIIVAFSGSVGDMEQLSGSLRDISVASLTKLQPEAWRETLMGSTSQANSVVHDLPIQTVAHAGFQSLAEVGDDPTWERADGTRQSSALIGFTEGDRQPSYLSASASSSIEGWPIMLCAGSTGAGKTVTLMWLAKQWSDQGTPVIFIDPKTHQGGEAEGFGTAVRNMGGKVASLSDLLTADGIFDPIRFASRPQDGISVAASLLATINPWGGDRQNMEAPLQRALAYGVANGALATGQAIRLAVEAGEAPQQMLDGILDVSDDPAFRAIVGFNPTTEGLRLSDKLTLIEAGTYTLDLPPPGVDPSDTSVLLPQRIASGLVRMMVQGSAMALTGRDGVVCLDEAWVALSAGFQEIDRLGRLARSQRVLPILFTQRVTDALNAGLSGYISRGLILPLEEAEARAACELFGIEPTPERLHRISGKAWNGAAPNWSSYRALWDRKGPGRKNLRGTIGLYMDLEDHVAPVEIVLPPEFLAQISTNALDVDARRAALAGG